MAAWSFFAYHAHGTADSNKSCCYQWFLCMTKHMFPRQLGVISNCKHLLSWQPYTLGCMERWKAVPGCMANRYCGGTFYPPTHYATKTHGPGVTSLATLTGTLAHCLAQRCQDVLLPKHFRWSEVFSEANFGQKSHKNLCFIYVVLTRQISDSLHIHMGMGFKELHGEDVHASNFTAGKSWSSISLALLTLCLQVHKKWTERVYLEGKEKKVQNQQSPGIKPRAPGLSFPYSDH